MEIKRFFLNSACVDNRFVIDGEEFEHLTKVLRYKVGYQAIICNDDGKDYLCTIESIGKCSAVAVVDSAQENCTVGRVKLTLFQAMPKGDKLDLIIQKACELGASEVTPFLSRFTNETKFNAERANRISKEACKQCGRAKLLQVNELTEFEQVVEEMKNFDIVIVPYENAEFGKIGDVDGLDKAQSVALVIGSEGGFAQEEVDALKQIGGKIVSLGKRILRCETAAIASIGLIMYFAGELGE
ncbi:MAG: RsmE family RNA methyltransferase [Clostridia bacterium]